MDHFEELKTRPIWTNYIRVWKESKQGYAKPLINPKNLYNGSHTNPDTQTDYQTAVKNIGAPAKFYDSGTLVAEQPIEGIGIVFNQTELAGIDLDHVLDPETGEIKEYAKKIVEDMDSYTEVSPSGEGLHIYLRDSESEDFIQPVHKDGIDLDLYSHRLYFTVTNKVYLDRPIRDIPHAMDRIRSKYHSTRDEAPAKANTPPVESGITEESTRRMVESALEAIRPADLEFNDWFAIGSALKQLGYSCDVWEDWSRDNGSNPKHVDRYTYKRWQKLRPVDTPEQLIIGKAKRYGWKASDVFTTAERWSYGRNQHTKEELAQYARQKAEEEAKDRETDEEFMKQLNRVIEESKASQIPQGEKVQPAEVDAREASKPEPLINKIRPIGSYVDGFIAECENPKPRYSTGFLSLDKRLNGGLFNELYILNAETSTGKSAISMTIAQNMAREGMNVLYFALEMGRNEFIARGASAISWEKTQDPEKAVTASDILYYHFDEKMLPFMKDGKDPFTKIAYSKYAEYVEEYRRRYEKNLYIIERPQVREVSGSAKVSGDAIAKITRDFYKAHPDKQLAIFVDYLQILEGEDSDRKTKTDKNISDLKDLCTQEKIPVFTISSIGRTGYKQGADIGNAKESGDIEYTTGVALGWDWDGVTNINTKNETWRNKRPPKEQKRLDREEYKNRLMLMSLLKYRNSERDTQDGLIYYPQYNYFREIDSDDLDYNRIQDIEQLGKVDIKDLLSGKIRI